MGNDKAEEYGKRNSSEGELLLKIKPTTVVGPKRSSRMIINLAFQKEFIFYLFQMLKCIS
jgi:hypothetical protein